MCIINSYAVNLNIYENWSEYKNTVQIELIIYLQIHIVNVYCKGNGLYKEKLQRAY